MTITIGTILLLCGIVGVFLRNYNSYRRLYLSLYTLMILIKLSINVGFFVSIGGYEILYDEVLTILIAVLALIGLLYYKVNLQIFYCLILFVSIILVSLILNIAGIYNVYGIPYGQSWDNYFYGKTLFQQLNVTATSFLMFARLIMFAISFIMFCKLIDFNYFKRLFKIVYRVSLFLAVIYILEFILKNIFHSAFLNNLYLDIFGHSLSTKDELGANVMGIYATIGLYREQSALATNFGLIALILLFGYKFTAKKKYLAIYYYSDTSLLLRRNIWL